MKKSLVLVAVMFSLFTSCTKEVQSPSSNSSKPKVSKISEEIEITTQCDQAVTTWINRNLNTSCPTRLPMISNILKNTDATIGNQTITEVQCTINGENYETFGYMIGGPINSLSESLSESATDGWETRQGYVLYCDGIFYHGIFFKIGDEWVFFPDAPGESTYDPIDSGIDMDTLC